MIFALFVILNIAIAYYHNRLRLKAIKENKPKAIYHGLWALGYVIACLVPFIFNHSYLLLGANLLLHLSIFPVAYNLFAKLPPYNLSTTSKSLIDQLMVKIGLKSTRLVNVLSFFSSIILVIYEYFK